MSNKNSISKKSAVGDDPLNLFTVEEAANILQCSVSSMNKWRLIGAGPPFVRVGRRIRYTRKDLADYIAASTRVSTSDRGRALSATA